MRLVELLNEGINDKGIFKALFLGGIPASGKSTIVNQIRRVTGVMPKVLNYDQFYEYLSKKHDIPISTKEQIDQPEAKGIRRRAKHLTTAQLKLYLAGMLPIIVDTTASDVAQLVERMSVMREHGYDLMMIYKKIDLEQSLERAKTRDRYVSDDHIRKMHHHEDYRLYEIGKYMRIKKHQFILLKSDSALDDHLSRIDNFFNSPVQNPIGKQLMNDLLDSGEKTIQPLPNKVDKWY
jgi:predicted kinase